ncbi:MAG: MFS transporter [Lacipirellulaceae bacterium]
MADETYSKRLFWGCFLALITTAFGFITRMFLLGEWGEEFNLTEAAKGELLGIGIWPFAISIIGFSLFIDRIGYKTAMVLSFLGYVIWSIMGVSAFFVSKGGEGDPELGYNLLYWGSLILGLSNGAVEAYINPVVATMFNKDKTKWLNILHAGWPGGLVIAGLITILLNSMQVEWWIRIAIIAPPAVIFFLMLIGERFPEQERVASGVSYREMLAEFGVLGTAIAGLLIALQLNQAFPTVNQWVFPALSLAAVIAVGVYTQSLGNPLLFVLALLMMPLATTEIGTDAWIEDIMKGVAKDKFDPGLVLVYTSAIMMVLRFFAGPIVHKLSPIGLLIASAALAIAGLYTLSFAQGMAIFAAATLYGVGKTFFWPTMLGIAGEQTPKGGALTLNALGGIGMLAVGTLGGVYIGALQDGRMTEAVAASDDLADQAPELYDEDGKLSVQGESVKYGFIKSPIVDDEKVGEALSQRSETDQKSIREMIKEISESQKQGALADVAIFPVIMLVGFIGLGLYFKSKGGYQAQQIDEAH